MSEDSAVKVCVRLRPLISREESSASENAEPTQLYWRADKKSIHQTDDGTSAKSFSFDRVFTAEETTDQLYQGIAKPLVVSTVEGYNGTIFAYGQTSSGKTFTMMGAGGVPGVIPLAVEDVFHTIKTYPKKEFLLRVSYMEIYNETVTDLLVDSWKRKPLEVRETINKNIYVADLTEEVVTSPAQALAWIRKGEKSRHYGKTKMNQRSSRSHTIFRMILESRERSDSEAADGAIIVSHLNLVDLAGSERASQTGAEGARFKEGCNINRSLFTLGQVIKKLTDEGQKSFTNYRDSKLTRILQNSLGGNAKTVIICTVTAAALDETLSTLQFASTAKKMKNDPHVTEVSDDGALLKRYRNEIVDLKRRLHEVSSVTQTTATEKEVLSQLLQEKDQLQREQEDKIRNLTRLLVTSSNPVPVKRKPQRRVTWGGQMRILAPEPAHPGGSSDLSFAEPRLLKRKVNHSCLSELAEEDDDFDPHWENPDEASDDMDVSQASASTQSFGDSPKDFMSSDRIRELSGKVSNLELQVEVESQQKQEATAKVEMLESRMVELDLQLQTEAQQKQEATEKVEMLESRMVELDLQLQTEAQQKVEMLESRMVELDLQLQTEAQQKQEATQKVEMLESRMVELDLQLQTEAQQKQEATEKVEMLESRMVELDLQLQTEAQQKVEMLESRVVELNLQLQTEAQQKVEMLESRMVELDLQLQTEAQQKQEATEKVEMLESRMVELDLQLQTEAQQKQEATEKVEMLESRMVELDLQLQTEAQQKVEMLESRVVELNLQLQTEAQQKVEMLESRMVELGLQLQTEAQQKQEATEKVEMLESRMVELDLQLQTEAQQKQEATEKVEMLESRMVELERRLEEQGHARRTDSEQMAREFAESVGLCESLSSEKEVIAAERDYLKQEVGVFLEQIQRLEKDKAAMSQELEERKETDEFEKLEEHFRKDHEAELQQEISTLKKTTESSEAKFQELQNNLENMSEELRKRTQFAEELKNMCGRDLVNEVAMLRRSLDEAEGVCRDTKKEWAFLRSRNMALEERDETLTADHKKMEAEVQSLRSQLEAEKVHFKRIQSDLQKELNGTFVENAKLIALLDGKVPQGLSDSVELQRTVTQLNQELAARREAEEVLQAQLQDLRGLPVQVDHLTKQVCELCEELSAVQSEKDVLSDQQYEAEELTRSLQTTQEEVLKVRQDLSAAAVRENELSRRLDEATQTLESLRSDTESLIVEKQQLMATTEESVLKLQESERHRASLSEALSDMERVLKELEAKLADSEESRRTEEEISKELQHQVDQLTEEASAQRSEVDRLQEKVQLQDKVQKDVETDGGRRPETLQPDPEPVNIRQHREADSPQPDHRTQGRQASREEEEHGSRVSDPPGSAEDTDHLMSTVAAVTAERDQLKTDLQENVDMMIEIQAELRAALEKNRHQKELIKELKVTQTRRQDGPDQGVDAQLEDLQTQVRSMSEELQSVRADRDRLWSERTGGGQSSTHHVEELLHTMTEERDQLQDTVETLRQDRQQLRGQLDHTRDTLQSEITQLTAQVHTVKEQKRQVEEDLHHNIHMASKTEALLKTLEEELCEQRQINCDLKALRHEQETLDQQIQTLTEKLHSTEAERDHLLCERQSSTQEVEKLVCTVTALTEDRDQLQDIVEVLRQDTQQLRGQLEQEADQVQQLKEQLQTSHERQTCVEAEAEASEQLLSDANRTVEALREQLRSLEVSPPLQDSTLEVQTTLRKLQDFKDMCSTTARTELDQVLRVRVSLSPLPRSNMAEYSAVCRLRQRSLVLLTTVAGHLQAHAHAYRILFDSLIKKDLAVFEERRLQDVLLCKSQAPPYSIQDQDLHSLWKPRVTELVDKRQRYLQKMGDILEKLQSDMASFQSQRSAELREREWFKEQLEAAPLPDLEGLLNSELEHRSALVHTSTRTLQDMTAEHGPLRQELELLEGQSHAQLLQERSRRSTLLQALEGAPLQKEEDLLLQLQEAADHVRSVRLENEELKEVQVRADEHISSHRRATQLLQTELQDSRAQVQEKDDVIRSLKTRVQEAEKKASPTGAEVETLKTRVLDLETERSVASDKHQQEILRLTTLLNDKEESLRRLKLNLRTSQQQGDQSFLQGKDLHARLTRPRGVVVQSTIALEKTKLEEEVTQLHLKITELQSLVSGHQAEVTKWRSRALRMKVRAETTTAQSPLRRPPLLPDPDLLTSPKRLRCSKILESPRKGVESPHRGAESPKVLNSPKSRFFDVDGSSDLLWGSRPKQFFDNSALGTVPGASVEAEQKEAWPQWPASPKKEDLCKTQ